MYGFYTLTFANLQAKNLRADPSWAQAPGVAGGLGPPPALQPYSLCGSQPTHVAPIQRGAKAIWLLDLRCGVGASACGLCAIGMWLACYGKLQAHRPRILQAKSCSILRVVGIQQQLWRPSPEAAPNPRSGQCRNSLCCNGLAVWHGLARALLHVGAFGSQQSPPESRQSKRSAVRRPGCRSHRQVAESGSALTLIDKRIGNGGPDTRDATCPTKALDEDGGSERSRVPGRKSRQIVPDDGRPKGMWRSAPTDSTLAPRTAGRHRM